MAAAVEKQASAVGNFPLLLCPQSEQVGYQQCHIKKMAAQVILLHKKKY